MVAEASRGLAGKQDHLGDATVTDVGSAPVAAGDEQTVEVAVSNEHGLHARPAAKLVALVHSFDAVVSLTDLETGRGPVDAGSLSLVATLNAQLGHHLRVGATGPQAAEVLEAVQQLAARAFDDTPVDAPVAAPVAEDRAAAGPGTGRGGSGLDVAVGPAVVVDRQVDLSRYRAGDAAAEQKRSDDARGVAAAALTALRDRTAEQVGEAEASIFDAHLALLDDPAPRARAARAISGGATAPEAWQQTFDELAANFEGLDDAYQRERAQDVRSVRDRLLRALTGSTEPGEPPAGAVLVVPELDAATAATLDAGRIAGVAVRAAGTTGHGVIVARSRGIPLVTGIGEVEVPEGALVAFDARAGFFVVEPENGGAAFRTTLQERAAERESAVAEADRPAVTVDGTTIQVLANVGSVQDALDALGADGSGLV
ncbi:MAG TPA: HPr family phosphocarrier protein, partial [Kribbella sp.]